MAPFEPLFSVGLSLHFDHDSLLNNSVRNRIAKNRIRKDFTPGFQGSWVAMSLSYFVPPYPSFSKKSRTWMT